MTCTTRCTWSTAAPRTDPDILTARPGERVRLRIINASADTIFTVALGGHDLTVTHTDGYPVEPVTTSTLRIGMGERYDAIVTLGDGVFALRRRAGRQARPGAGAGAHRRRARPPARPDRPSELDGYPLTVGRPACGGLRTRLPERDPDSVQDLLLSGSMAPYVWTINGARTRTPTR